MADATPAPQGKQQGFTIADLPNHPNIAELLDEERLTSIATSVWDEYDIDKKSRIHKEEIWNKTSEAFNLKSEAKSFPFSPSANVKFPVLTVACLQFAARAMPAIVHDGKVAKGKVIGREREQPEQPLGNLTPNGSAPGPMMDGPPQPPLGPGAPPPQMGMGAPASPMIPPEMMPPEGGMPPMPSPDGMGGPAGMGGPSPLPPLQTKQDQADRIAGYMNYQMLDKDTAWITEMDQGLHQLPAFGAVIKKVYRDPVFGNRSELVSVRDFVVNAAYPSLERAPRCTQRFDLYPNEIEERKRDGRFLPIELINTPTQKTDDGKDKNAPQQDLTDKSAPHEFLEQHRLIDLDEDGYQEPYCVTLHVSSKKVVRIVASYGAKDIVLKKDANDVVMKDEQGNQLIARIKPYRYFIKYEFLPDIEGGFYGTGFGELLMHPVEVINTVINQMINAGILATAGGGFIGKEFRLKSGEIKVSPGKYPMVPFLGDDIRKGMYHHQWPEPSAVLFQLLGFLVEQTEKIVSSPEVLTGEAPANQPATTTLALIEQGLKVFTGIIGRVLRALGHELKVMYELNARYIEADQKEYFNYGDDEQYVMGKDFDPAAADVIPVADATMSTDMQKMAKAEAILNMASHPVFGAWHHPREVLQRFYEAMAISTSGLVVDQPPPPPIEPKDELAATKFAEIEKPMAELDGALKQIQLFNAIAALPPDLQRMFGIEEPIKPNLDQDMQEQDMAHRDESHEADMAGKAQKMDHAEQGMNLKKQQAQRAGQPN